MKGWIIYNGALRIKKMEALVFKLAEEGKKKGYHLKLIKNNELIPAYCSLGKPQLHSVLELDEPDFVIFWDKDILLAKHLELMGFRLFNTPEAIEDCDNKALMHLKLARAGIRVPKTILGPFTFHQHNLSDGYLDKVFAQLGERIILKEAYGSFGMQVHMIDSREALKQQILNLGNRPFIMQQYIHSSYGRDIRVNIIGNRMVGAMARTSPSDFRTNITLGATGELVELNQEQREIALKAHAALNLDFSGIDLLFGEDNEPILCEVNSNVNYLSFEEASGVNFSHLLLDWIREAL
ncbi:gamma-F420-2:alpha-L-glutamate ligase [Natronincola peptidivorans]|uniref:Gamma-F420-2:alpha-L-glutamate ligase n=1 Tax=Natronincola peptidivorans TaxID=426128 RepID=A0A1H9ZI46_9FIRM|nr:RimK family alpha-L-glutamate ligase [Natronincola peptidivorans]SES81369.1 gamma-F420-2:alpha-L-glutamate ligase [Natronincola peptidivorans]